MPAVHSVAQLADRPLLDRLAQSIRGERAALVQVLACIGEVERRRLYRQEGFPSMYKYCVHHLKLSEQGAFRRIRAARLAREFPRLLAHVAEGRLHLTALVLLKPHVTSSNA